MPISKFIPVAIMVGIFGALWAIIGTKMNLVLWVPFISWALFFMAGAKFSRLHKEVIGLTGGLIAAVLLVWLLPSFTNIFGATLGLPVLVFLAAFSIVMLELTDWLELAPAYFFSFAGYFAFLFGGFVGQKMTFSNVFNFWILLLVGLLLGVITQFLRDTILSGLKVPPEERQTVFDKERKISV
jgi:hypothetical protein